MLRRASGVETQGETETEGGCDLLLLLLLLAGGAPWQRRSGGGVRAREDGVGHEDGVTVWRVHCVRHGDGGEGEGEGEGGAATTVPTQQLRSWGAAPSCSSQAIAWG